MGGKAFANTVRVTKDQVFLIVKQLSIISGLSLENRLLGSAGKKDTSGDIDIAVTSEEFNTLVEKFSTKFKVDKTSNRFSIFYNTDETNGIQVDFLKGDLEFLKFFYHSPTNSLYKGAHRNIALSARARTIIEINDDTLDEYGRYKDYTTLRWSSNGLVKVRFRTKYRNGKVLKTLLEENVTEYMTDKHEIIKTLFGEGATESDCDSLESVIAIATDNREIFLNKLATNLVERNIDPGVQYPLEVLEYISDKY